MCVKPRQGVFFPGESYTSHSSVQDRAPNNAAFGTDLPPVGGSFQFIICLACPATFSYLLLIKVAFALALLLSKGGIPTQTWKTLTCSTGRGFCCNFLCLWRLCITGCFILDVCLVFLLLIFFPYFSDFLSPIVLFSNFFDLYGSFPPRISNPFHYVRSLWHIHDIVTENVFSVFL